MLDDQGDQVGPEPTVQVGGGVDAHRWTPPATPTVGSAPVPPGPSHSWTPPFPSAGAYQSPYQPTVTPPPPGPAPGWKYVNFGPRFGALLLDWLLLGIVNVTLLAVGGGFDKTVVTSSTGTMDWFTLNSTGFVLAAILSGVYFTVSWSAFGRTVGQRVSGVFVLRAKDGGRLGAWQSALRSLWFVGPSLGGAVAGALFPLLGLLTLIGLLVSLGDRRRQGWHDRTAGSVVASRTV